MMKLNSSLFNIPFVNNVLFYETITSTNDKAKELAKRGSVHGSLVVARTQTSGRGRLGRDFDSSSDQGLYFSLLLRPDVTPEHLSGITLVTALAVSKAIDNICNVKTSIKWPNDIFINNKKAVGILTESGQEYVIIGIGVNANTKSFDKALESTATSIFLETGNEVPMDKLLQEILMQLNNLYDEFIKNNDLSFAMKEYNLRLGSINKEVYIIPQQRSLQSPHPSLIDISDIEPVLCLGIDKTGNLICKNSNGDLCYVNSGEVSLRAK